MIGQFWNSDVSWKMLGSFSQIDMSYLSHAWLVPSIIAWPVLHICLRMRENIGKKEKMSVIFDNQFYVNREQLVTSMCFLEESLLSIYILGEILL